jgi:predicted phage baseplate assembly protein
VPVEIGIDHILFNAVSAHNALTIPVAETLGQSDGKPFQVFPLQNRPLFKRLETDTPYDHLKVQVGGATWTLVDDLPAGAGDIYRVDPVAGEISFGNFDPTRGTGHGSIPPSGSPIVATGYRYVAGGVSGNVGAGRIDAVRTPVAGIIGVTNLFSSFDASDEEPIAETLRRAPEELKVRSRAVTTEDYEFLAREATTDVVIVRCFEPRTHEADNQPAWKAGDPWTFGAIVRAPGNVNVVVVPDQGSSVTRPEPTTDLLREVQAYLDRRRDLTAHLAVIGPRYLPVKVTVDVKVWQRALDGGKVRDLPTVRADTMSKIVAFLHPTRGGREGKGWQVGQHVFIADLFKAIMPSEDVGYISTILVEADIPAYHNPPLGPGGAYNPTNERPFPLAPLGASVRMAEYELVCSATTPQNTPAHTVNVSVEV